MNSWRKENCCFSLKAFLSIVLAVALVASMMPGLSFAEESGAESTTVEKKFANPGRLISKEEVEEQLQNGGVVRLFDTSDIDYKNQSNSASLASDGESALPKKVDLRTTNTVSQVKNQGGTSTCWAWAANAAAETSISRSCGKAAEDLSAYQTAYFGYVPLSSNESELKGTEKSQKGEGVSLTDTYAPYSLQLGGTIYQPPSEMMQGIGPAMATSISFPYHAIYEDATIADDDKLSSIQRRNKVASLSKWNNLGSLIITEVGASRNPEYVATDTSVLESIKEQVAQGNAVQISYFGDDHTGKLQNYYNTTTNAQYTYEWVGSNHAVCVVGYDDEYAVTNFKEGHQPSQPGAFIIKNSWGESYADAGYFYLSYYDQSISEASSYEFDTTDYDTSNIGGNEIVDQYDYMQMMTASASYYPLSTGTSSKGWYANIYTASEKQSLHNIGTYVYASNSTLGYKVYKLKSDATSPKDIQGSFDSPVDEGTETVDYGGFISIKLDTPLNLQQGEKYTIWFYQTDSISDGDYVYYYLPYSVGPDSNYAAYFNTEVVINSEESFDTTTPESAWNEMTTSDTGEPGYVHDNYCVKGYSTSAVNSSFVKFNSNNGTSVAEQVVANGGKVTEPTAPTKAGATFAGWYKDAALTQQFNFATDTVSADTTLYAGWKHNITYELDGGTNPTTNPSTYVEGVGVTSFANATQTGYTFEGWWSKNGKTSGDWGTQITSISTTQTTDVTLYAKWAVKKFKVTFVDWDETTVLKTDEVQEGTVATPPANPEREDYTFTGWSPDITTKITAETTFIAQYTQKPTFKVTFDTDGGSSVNEQNVITGKCATKPATDPTKNGYKFAGWFNADKTTAFDFTKPITEATTAYAVWTKVEYKIEFKDRAADLGIADVTYTIDDVNSGKTVQITAQPKKNGYNFKGWVDSSGNTVTEIKLADIVTCQDITLSASWDVVQYKITFEGVDGVSNPNVAVYTIESDTIVLKDLVRDGYKFLGWYMKKTDSAQTASLAAVVEEGGDTSEYGEKVTEIKNGTFGNITLTALWQKVEASAAENDTTNETTNDTTTTDNTNSNVTETTSTASSTSGTSETATQAGLAKTGDSSLNFAVMVGALVAAFLAFVGLRARRENKLVHRRK